MKKLLTALVIFAVAGSAAFAEITWSGSGRLVLTAVGLRFANSDINEDDPGGSIQSYFGADNPYGSDGPGVALSVTGSRAEGNMGFKASIATALGTSTPTLRLDDCSANLWFKPFGGIFETFQVTFGIFNVDNLRFKFAGAGSSFHNWVWYVRGDLGDEDAVFRRWRSKGFGTHIQWEPIQNLYIGWGLGSVGDARAFQELKADGFVNALISSQVGVGYAIPNIGRIRAQFTGPRQQEWVQDGTTTNGKWSDAIDVPLESAANAARIAVAFNLTAVQGLNIDIGSTIPLAYEREYWSDYIKTEKTRTVKTQDDIVIGLGFDLTIFNPFRLWGFTTVKLGGYQETTPVNEDSTKVNYGTDFAINLTPMYTVAPNNIVGIDLFLDVRTGSDQNPIVPDGDPTMNPADDAKNNYVDLGFGVWYRRNIAGGDIRIAVTLKLPGLAGEAHEGAAPQLYLPIMFNYNF
jgi:hypothetical protein